MQVVHANTMLILFSNAFNIPVELAALTLKVLQECITSTVHPIIARDYAT